MGKLVWVRFGYFRVSCEFLFKFVKVSLPCGISMLSVSGACEAILGQLSAENVENARLIQTLGYAIS